jgi:hypothetical protein
MIAGMIPVALARGDGAETRVPMALVIIGGLVTSTLLTLGMVPVAYSLIDAVSQRLQRFKGSKDVTPRSEPPGSPSAPSKVLPALVSIAYLTLTFLQAPDAVAAEAPSGPAVRTVLTLDQALAEAESQNPDLRAARARLRQSEELGAEAWSAYLPNVTASGGYTRNAYAASFPAATGYVVRDLGVPQGGANLPGTETTEVAVPVGVQNIAIQKLNVWSAGARLSQPLIAPTTVVAIKSAYLSERSSCPHDREHPPRDHLCGGGCLHQCGLLRGGGQRSEGAPRGSAPLRAGCRGPLRDRGGGQGGALAGPD